MGYSYWFKLRDCLDNGFPYRGQIVLRGNVFHFQGIHHCPAALLQDIVHLFDALSAPSIASKGKANPVLGCKTFHIGQKRGDRWNLFSSRRRHTRSDRDWSSDVCSSDLSRRHSPFFLRYSRVLATVTALRSRS